MKTKIKLLNLIGKNALLLKLINKFYEPTKTPNMLSIHITNKCNLQCLYCYEKLHSGQLLTTAQIKTVIAEAQKNGFKQISFLGGEPLLHKDIIPILDSSSKLGFGIKVFTNGTFLNNTLLGTFKKCPKFSLIVKFDCKDSYKKTIGQDIFGTVRANIQKCVDAKMKVITLITVTKENLEFLHETLENALTLNTLPIIERYIPLSMNNLEISPSEWNKSLDTYHNIISNHFSIKKSMLKNYYRVNSKIRGYYCPSFISSMSIDAYGNVLPCAIAPPNMSIGNITKESFTNLIKKYAAMRDEWNKAPDECKTCNHVDICKGGCKLHSYIKNKNFDSKDPLCCENNIPLINC